MDHRNAWVAGWIGLPALAFGSIIAALAIFYSAAPTAPLLFAGTVLAGVGCTAISLIPVYMVVFDAAVKRWMLANGKEAIELSESF